MDIVSLTLSGATTKAGGLISNNLAGLLLDGSNWTSLRIGARFAFASDPGAGGVIASKFFFGLGSGKTTHKRYGAVTPSGQSLAGLDVGTSADLLYSSPGIVYYPSGTPKFSRIVNGTRTGGSSGSANAWTFAAAASPNAHAIIYEMDKSASTYVLKAVGTAAAGGTTPVAVTQAQLLAAMVLPTMTDVAAQLQAATGYAYSAVTDGTGIVSGATYEATNGEFNAIHFGWSAGSPTLVIDSICYVIVTP